jgi:hypothetical protein
MPYFPVLDLSCEEEGLVCLGVSYEETQREVKGILIYECRCNERLNVKTRDLYVVCVFILFILIDDSSYYIRIKKERTDANKCHVKTLMSLIADKEQK